MADASKQPNLSWKADGGENVPQVGTVGDDPDQIVAKALLCFNNRYINSSCEESCRLTASGNINVPYGSTDQYCNGPCLTETYLILNCIDDILANFSFYNNATIQDVRDTIKAGCGYGPERGNFNVTEHIQAEEGTAGKAAAPVLSGICLMIIGHALLL
ncbi:Glycine-rich family protein putative isoform 2 [Tripterygium wilfordii]|uniref:Glycine-rich family protein putative isoform 2 n=1 Tax=Tripterygium wilfordii TaxID=458696 RepID=A0A7J7CSF5_TRIWF|nr:Glycine-rich family protein putative isoform 2 [Tripterygium wilfordii]